ncbi:Poly-adenylate binding protein, unique domain [Musa troglodytarum]|uniref:Poly-adenylate binding protein, unique domain n=1 Tax=Musa troglodytarum TaxID=320322 RepID=A0A9E7HLH4_9LILI|nr:Poly-adenylate binding protein, unique domain [Musa troglodytarum]
MAVAETTATATATVASASAQPSPMALYVGDLADDVAEGQLVGLFSAVGELASVRICKDSVTGRSLGYGYVNYISPHDGIASPPLRYVANFIRKSDRVSISPEANFTNLYMKNLDQDITEELIKLKFSEFGTNTLYVARAQKKAERMQVLRRLYEEKRNEQIRKYMASNVYVKNIDDAVDNNALRERFSEFGNITSAKVMLDEKGRSKGFGFVCYSTPEEATRAVNSLRGSMFYGKPLYVAIAQRKEERQAQLQMMYAQRMAGSPAAVLPTGYGPLYYASSGVVSQVPPRQGVMYQPFGIRPGWRPNGFVAPSRPIFQSMPLPAMSNTSRQHRQNRGRMNGNVLPQSGQTNIYMPHLQQANHSVNTAKDLIGQQRSGQAKYVPNGHQHEINNASLTSSGSNSQGTEMLSSMLAAATPQQQKQILGERLFPLVEKLKFDLAAKITGMLLEMDNSELLLLLESPESLAAKVEEAVQVLKLSNATVGGQENIHSNYLTSNVTVN